MLRILVIFTTLPNVININGKEIYERSADDIFGEVLGMRIQDVPSAINARKRTMKYYDHSLPSNLSDLNKDYVDINVTTPLPTKEPITTRRSTTEGTPLPQVTPLFTPEEMKHMNTTEEYMKSRMLKLKIKNIIDEDFKPTELFSIDTLEHDTRRFEKLLETEHTRREVYLLDDFKHDMMNRTYREKKQLLELMKQFIYTTRYLFPYVQLIRKKYLSQPRYKIGFCFALLRELRWQQKLIYNSFRPNIRMYYILYISIRMYEKIVRLGVDIEDVIKLIKYLNYLRVVKDDPEYYVSSDEGPPDVRYGGYMQYDPKKPNRRSNNPEAILSSEEILKLPSQLPTRFQESCTPRPYEVHYRNITVSDASPPRVKLSSPRLWKPGNNRDRFAPLPNGV